MRCIRLFVVVTFALTFAACSGIGGTNQAASNSGLIPTTHAKPAFSTNGKYWVLTDLGAGLPGSPGLVPASINDKGTVVGEASVGILGSLPSCSPQTCGPPEGWVYQNGSLSALPALGTDLYTFADDINNRGTISGGSASDVTEEAVLWNTNGTITNLGTGLVDSDSSAEAIGISNSAKIVGTSYDAYAEIPTGFSGNGVYSAPCGLSAMGLLYDVTDSGLAAAQIFSDVSGSVAATCSPLRVIETPVVGHFGDVAFDINDKGEVVGRHIVGPGPGNFHPFLYRNGSTTDLGTLFPGNPAAIAAAFSINKSGAIAGWSGAGGGVFPVEPIDPRAYVFTHGQMIDLNSLLAPTVASNWTLVVASAINEKGQIAGSAFVGGYPNGVEHAFLLSPPGLAMGSAAKIHQVPQGGAARGSKVAHRRWTHAPVLQLRQSLFGNLKG